ITVLRFCLKSQISNLKSTRPSASRQKCKKVSAHPGPGLLTPSGLGTIDALPLHHSSTPFEISNFKFQISVPCFCLKFQISNLKLPFGLLERVLCVSKNAIRLRARWHTAHVAYGKGLIHFLSFPTIPAISNALFLCHLKPFP